MKVVNEALRMFLAITALVLTAMLTNPSGDTTYKPKPEIARVEVKDAKKLEREIASTNWKGQKIALRTKR